jgi:hypothetical protein
MDFIVFLTNVFGSLVESRAAQLGPPTVFHNRRNGFIQVGQAGGPLRAAR